MPRGCPAFAPLSFLHVVQERSVTSLRRDLEIHVSSLADILLLGGTTGMRLLPDCWALDTETFVWRPLMKMAQTWPAPSFFHTAVLIRGRYLVTFGGVFKDNQTRSCWILTQQQTKDAVQLAAHVVLVFIFFVCLVFF